MPLFAFALLNATVAPSAMAGLSGPGRALLSAERGNVPPFEVINNFGPYRAGRPTAPAGGVIADRAGVLYGTTYDGGLTSCDSGCGVVYSLTPTGTGYAKKVLYHFTGGSDGGKPTGPLLRDTSGDLFGVSTIGGDYGGGNVFELRPTGSRYVERTLYSSPDYVSPALFEDSNGSLYGSSSGGPNDDGFIFKLAGGKSNYAASVLYSFSPTIGTSPLVLALGSAGEIYGALGFTPGNDAGALFKLTPSSPTSSTYAAAILHVFDGQDGAQPSGLTIDSSGRLIGETLIGGGGPCNYYLPGGCGTIFVLSPEAGGYAFDLAYVFKGRTDGELPGGGLVFGQHGTLYGTTSPTGCLPMQNPCGYGSVFELQTGNRFRLRTLHTFTTGGPNSQVPLLSSTGVLFGTTEGGGQFGDGTAFAIDTSR
jgi:hypothetical protein